MVFGFGGFGIDNLNVSSKWTIGGDGKSMIESDNFYFNSDFNAGMGTFSGGCYGGGGKFNWGALVGSVLGGATMLGMALLSRGRGGAGAGRPGGIFGGGSYGMGSGSYGMGAGSIFGGGFGGYNPYNSGYLIDSVGSGFNNNPIKLHDLQYRDGADGAGTATGSTATDGTGKKGNTADNDGKTPSTDNDNNKGKTPSTDNNNNQGKTPSTDNNNKKPGSTSQGDNNGGDENGKKQPVSEGDGVPTGAYLKALIDGGKVGNTDYDGNAAGKADTKGQGVASLKGDAKDTEVRKNWSDYVNGTRSPEPSEKDYKDAVKLGKADGTGDADVSKDGYPTYFTITDYRSHNMYTFEFSQVAANGELKYKLSTKESNLSQDDAKKYNGIDWIAEQGADGKEFSVSIVNGEIVLDNKSVIVAHKGK